jgi:asparaginyl-tRNA synthetase
MQREKISSLYASTTFDRPVRVLAWVRTKRSGKKVSFLALNDGSTFRNLQAVVDNALVDEALLARVATGATVAVEGTLVATPTSQQPIEVQVTKLEVLGEANPEEYPLQKKGHTLEFLREVAHLRARTTTFSSVFRLRSALAFALHQFFFQKGFYYIHTPIITGSDCEGAGEMFQVTTLALASVPKDENGLVDFAPDFFQKPTHLTVSGQLNGELAAMGMGEIYTFGPTFRAENSNTTRHLAEFWMIEPEMAFYDLEDNMNLAEEMLRYLIRFARDNYPDDLKFLNDTYDDGLLQRLDFVLDQPFARVSYTQAVEILQQSGKAFEFPVDWGTDLQTEHERYLVEEHFGKPVIVTDYPKHIKAFYMRQNEDGKTVRAMDILFPGIGEIIGGSQREERHDQLLARIREMGLPEENYWWYLDTRRFGTAPHSGFGLGFERLVMFVTGMGNIRDVIPFPRTPGNAEF